MKVRNLHGWSVSPSEALELQRQLASRVSSKDDIDTPRFIAGVDISTSRVGGVATAAVVVIQYPELTLVETRVVWGKLDFPYVPGLLSFREAPMILAACKELKLVPDIIMVDGQGIAHPRRLGLASHLGLFLDTPTIGCAKSLLCGIHEMPGEMAGNYAVLVDGNETIGVALRTKVKVKPIYISVGHKISLPAAIEWVMKCCRNYRLPEPTRLAHLTARSNYERGSDIVERDYREKLMVGKN